VAEVIGPEPELEAVFRDSPAGRRQTGVVDEDVDRTGERQDAFCALADRGEVSEVELDEAGLASDGSDRLEHLNAPRLGTIGEHRRRATARELDRRGPPNARARAGNDDEAAREIAFGDDHGQDH
jgi:hypothetical protein